MENSGVRSVLAIETFGELRELGQKHGPAPSMRKPVIERFQIDGQRPRWTHERVIEQKEGKENAGHSRAGRGPFPCDRKIIQAAVSRLWLAARHCGELCPTRHGKNQKGAPVSRSALKLKGIVAHYLMPEVLVLLADLALGSRLSKPSVADTATSDPSRRARTTGK